MKLNEIVGITDPENPLATRARLLVDNDNRLLDELVALRRQKRMTQAEIADIMGVSQGAVARIESGERDPHLSTLRRYAMAIGAVVEHEVVDHSARRPSISVFYTSGINEAELLTEVSDPRETLQLASHAWAHPSHD